MGDADAFGHQFMQATVLFQQAGQPLLKYLVDGFLPGRFRERGVQLCDGVCETLLQDDIVIAFPLGMLTLGANVVPMCQGVAQGRKLLQQRPFHIGFGQKGHGHSPSEISCTSGSLMK